MSGGQLHSNLVPINDVNDEEVQRVGRFAVEAFNKGGGHRLIYKGVVNGLSCLVNAGRIKYFFIVIEAKNEDCIPWSYIAEVHACVSKHKMYNLLYFEDVLKDCSKH